MSILKYHTRNEWKKHHILRKKLNPLIRQKLFTLAWGGFWLVWKRFNASNSITNIQTHLPSRDKLQSCLHFLFALFYLLLVTKLG